MAEWFEHGRKIDEILEVVNALRGELRAVKSELDAIKRYLERPLPTGFTIIEGENMATKAAGMKLAINNNAGTVTCTLNFTPPGAKWPPAPQAPIAWTLAHSDGTPATEMVGTPNVDGSVCVFALATPVPTTENVVGLVPTATGILSNADGTTTTETASGDPFDIAITPGSPTGFTITES
jgi:hypothetical protein